MRTLGIIGGIGPESTIEYYRLLIAGYRERVPDGSYPPLLINSIDVNKMLALVAAAPREELVEYLLDNVFQLARAGADFALLASNTPHIAFSELSARSPIPLVSIVQVTCDFAQAHGLRRLGLFGTRFTMQAGFYQEACAQVGIEVVTPGPNEQTYIHEKYMGELVKGLILPETRARLLAIAKGLKEHQKIDGLILGGTELPLILRDERDLGIPFLDTMRIHVNAALDAMLP
jgi:aspartate racemase